jgi:acetyltransferase-like isoleucine patch superfamily enzyme
MTRFEEKCFRIITRWRRNAGHRFDVLRNRWASTWYGLGHVGKDCNIGRGVRFIGATHRIRLGDRVTIGDSARLICTNDDAEMVIGDGTTIQSLAILDTGPGGKILMGRSNSVNPYCVIYGHGSLVTGDFVRIAANTVIIPANHIFDSADKPIAKQGLDKKGIRIGRDVWIASGCSILDGVQIGDGAVVAAGSVVNRSIPPFAVAAGVPARIIKMRPGFALSGEGS